MITRAAMIDEFSYVYNVIVIDDSLWNMFPNLILAVDTGNIGDFWNGSVFIQVGDPTYPPHP